MKTSVDAHSGVRGPSVHPVLAQNHHVVLTYDDIVLINVSTAKCHAILVLDVCLTKC